jgi:hypothetical protein
MFLRFLAIALVALMFAPGTASAQQIQTQDGQTLDLVPIISPAALVLQDLGDDYGLLDYDTVRNEGSPRTDFLIAYERFDDAPTRGPLYVELRLVMFAGAPPQTILDDALRDYLASGAPDLRPMFAPSGYERFYWFEIDDPLSQLAGYATLLPTENGFASIATMGDASEFSLGDAITITRAAAGRLGV